MCAFSGGLPSIHLDLPDLQRSLAWRRMPSRSLRRDDRLLDLLDQGQTLRGWVAPGAVTVEAAAAALPPVLLLLSLLRSSPVGSWKSISFSSVTQTLSVCKRSSRRVLQPEKQQQLQMSSKRRV